MNNSKNKIILLPRFSVSDKVIHRSKDRVASVTEVINLNDPEDVQIQGYRYYVSHSGDTWSVKEEDLLLHEKNVNNISPEKARNSSILPPDEELHAHQGVGANPETERLSVGLTVAQYNTQGEQPPQLVKSNKAFKEAK